MYEHRSNAALQPAALMSHMTQHSPMYPISQPQSTPSHVMGMDVNKPDKDLIYGWVWVDQRCFLLPLPYKVQASTISRLSLVL